MVKLSIVSPVFKADSIVFELVKQITAAVQDLKIEYEIVLVDDDSPDHSWRAIKEASASFRSVRGIKLSRNFGQHIAITAGLTAAQGEWIVVMDCDLQDNPNEIPIMYKYAVNNNYQIVQAKRKNRKDKILKRWASKLFYWTFSYMAGFKKDPEIANFGIYNRIVIDSVLRMNDRIRFFPLLINWVGFRRCTLEVEHQSRYLGSSSYSIQKLLDLAFYNIISFSDKPLRLTIKVGFLISLISFAAGFVVLILRILGIIKVLGYAGIIISLYLSLGIILLVLGIVGFYVGNVLELSKDRPLFIIQEKFD